MTLDIHKLPPVEDLAVHLMTEISRVEIVRPSCYIGDWHVYYDPDSISYSGQRLPWVARIACRMIQCDTLARLLEALKQDDDSSRER